MASYNGINPVPEELVHTILQLDQQIKETFYKITQVVNENGEVDADKLGELNGRASTASELREVLINHLKTATTPEEKARAKAVLQVRIDHLKKLLDDISKP